MTESRLKANRENAKKGGRPRGSMNGDKLSLRDRCRVRDEEHVRILESIAADSTHEGSGPGGAIPFSVILPAALCDDDD